MENVVEQIIKMYKYSPFMNSLLDKPPPPHTVWVILVVDWPYFTALGLLRVGEGREGWDVGA